MKKAVLLCCVGVAACSRPQQPAVKPDVHYVVGPAWQAGATWVYPREDFSYQARGLAVRQAASTQPLTTDGEVRNPLSMTGSHPTLQLPAVVTVINLDNGREITIRVNDRGPAEAGRVLGLSPKAADLLGVGAEPARVRVVEDEVTSRQLAEVLPGGPMLQINAAPREAVRQTDLGASNAALQNAGAPPQPEPQAASAGQVTAQTAVQLPELPAQWRQGQPEATQLWVETADFTARGAAARLVAQDGGSVWPSFTPQGKMWAVRQGPFTTISDADAALKRALADGLTGSHIVVE
ncbi:SPOR domain-containing protein [Acetobacter malorum]|uniref:SPOR domain-containing protein n=1 Tax=Acetobacter malorum TaxID=178901 RepID=UPI00248E3FE8|nr:SPOR domain-containing protein [Acetobacter malorum]